MLVDANKDHSVLTRTKSKGKSFIGFKNHNVRTGKMKLEAPCKEKEILNVCCLGKYQDRTMQWKFMIR